MLTINQPFDTNDKSQPDFSNILIQIQNSITFQIMRTLTLLYNIKYNVFQTIFTSFLLNTTIDIGNTQALAKEHTHVIYHFAPIISDQRFIIMGRQEAVNSLV
jgi:hypothetical protein